MDIKAWKHKSGVGETLRNKRTYEVNPKFTITVLYMSEF